MDEAVIARLETHGARYEVLVDPDLALDFKHGKTVNISQILAIDTIFKDSKKGDKASEEHMRKIFKTSDPLEVAATIIKKGDIQFTTEQRRRMLEDRKKQVISIIAKNAINPQTGAPHPPQRIEAAMEEAKVRVSLSRGSEEQVQEVLKELRSILPIKFEERTVAVKIPAQYAGKAYSVVKSFGTVKKEEWQKDGSWIVMMNLPAGVVEDFFRDLNALTKGDIETKILEKD